MNLAIDFLLSTIVRRDLNDAKPPGISEACQTYSPSVPIRFAVWRINI